MKVYKIHENDIKRATERIVNRKIVYHPQISPNGKLDFTSYYGKNYICIFDRNIYTNLIELCKNGYLNNKELQVDIASLMFWMQFNRINGTGGLALLEYCHSSGNNTKSNIENSIFKSAFNNYEPDDWIKLINLGNVNPLIVNEDSQSNFEIEPDHYVFQYLMTLKMQNIDQLMLKGYEKFLVYFKWMEENVLISGLTLVYSALLFSNKIKPLIRTQTDKKSIKKACKNQAWDLCYLSSWSTFFWNDYNEEDIYLFCTFDKGLKSIMDHSFIGHNPELLFKNIFGAKNGTYIKKQYDSILMKHTKKTLDMDFIKQQIEIEEEQL
ncbi:hypothetical protein [Fusibacter ferrireducens]|uniref:Uncharacterized protein n=1 Tax=Fusibacter ferrireducens TaxID=2785058 RepID=A0ABS0A1H2_9FIRM|nr:hypothetical protein [Fusibacter ferrireducens]MBF4696061.1 hypothetical protein [Fusibacter ferrireducens]